MEASPNPIKPTYPDIGRQPMLTDPITRYDPYSPSTWIYRLGYILSLAIYIDVIKIRFIAGYRQPVIIRLVLLAGYGYRDIHRLMYRVTVQRDINRERLRYCLYQCLIDRIGDAVMYRVNISKRVGLMYLIAIHIPPDMVASRETGYQAH